MSGLAIELSSQRCRRRLETWIISLDWGYSLPHEELRSEDKEVKKGKPENHTMRLIDAIEHLLNGDKDSRLIFDPLEKPYLWVKVDDHFEMLELSEKNKSFKKFCFRLVKKLYDISLKDDETFKNALLAIEVKAEEITEKKGFELHPSNLGYRRTWFNSAAWYDLCNKEWEGIQIDENGYRKASLLPIFLRRGSESPQIEPVYNAKPEEVNRIFKYINVVNEDKKLLVKSWVCSAFVPIFRGHSLPQPILSLSGVTGTGKTGAAKKIKALADPCRVDVRRLPENVEDLSVVLNKNGLTVFDNIGSKILQNISDTLCIATTKGYDTRRKLYTNDEEAALRLDSSIIFTSIQIEKMNDDLINRTIFIETSKFNSSQKRKTELELQEEFVKDLPYILGGIFASISQALKIFPTLEDIDTGDGGIRMLDFALFGESLSRVWGNGKMKFFAAYNEMQGVKTSETIEENQTLEAFISYIKNTKSYYGPLGELLKEIKKYYIDSGMGLDTSYFVTNATNFSKKLKQRDGTIASMGIEVVPDEKQTDGKTFYNITYNGPIVDNTQKESGQTSIIDETQKGW